jgi:hypothetical protein
LAEISVRARRGPEVTPLRRQGQYGSVEAVRYEGFKPPGYAPPPLLKRMVVSGHDGRKTGRGFYEYATTRVAVAA